MIALPAAEGVLDASGIAPRIEALLPSGARRRQLAVRTLLLGMLLALADGRPAHLTRVHKALASLPECEQRRAGRGARREDSRGRPLQARPPRPRRRRRLPPGAVPGRSGQDPLPAAPVIDDPGPRPPRYGRRRAALTPRPHPHHRHHHQHRTAARACPHTPGRSPEQQKGRPRRPGTSPARARTTVPPEISDPNVKLGLHET